MSKQHTPGPWKVVNGWKKDSDGTFIRANGTLFPSVIEAKSTFEKGETLMYYRFQITVNSSHDQEIESIMANAELIAAAPETASKLEAVTKERDELNEQLETGATQYAKSVGRVHELESVNAKLIEALKKLLPKLSQLQDETAFTWPEKIENLIKLAEGK